MQRLYLRHVITHEPTLSELYSEADDHGVVINPEHVLHQFLTEREQTYNLRRRPHGS